MSHPKTLFTTTATIAVLAGSSAYADVTAEDIWRNFQDFGARYGQRITGTESFSSGVLTVTNVEMGMTVPEAEISAKIDELTFAEQSDGTVLIQMSPEIAYDMSIDPAEGESAQFKMLVRQEGMKMVAGGDAIVTTYDYTADLLSLDVIDFAVEEDPAELTGNFTMSGVTGSYTMKDASLATGDTKMAVAQMDYAFSVSDPSESTNVEMGGSVKDLTSDAVFALPSNMNPTNLAEMLKAGMMVKGGYTYGSYELDMNVDDGTQPGAVSASAGKGALNFELSDQAIDYGGEAEDVSMTLSGMEIPFPELNFSFEKTGGRLQIPVDALEDAGDFALKIELVGLSISEQLWGMFDPTAVLPRDPATLIIDTTGKLRWLFDIFDPEAAALVETTGGEPAEVEALEINNLVLSLIGAELTGEGGFTFDNSDKTTFDGMPKPTGSIALNLIGANGVMDNLVKLGFVPEEQVMGARMMLGLFARPGAGADELVSEIQVTEDGQVLANGQRLR